MSSRTAWRYRRWLVHLTASCLLLIATAVLVNLVVDPFGIYRWVDIEGFNGNKYQATKHTRAIKPYLFRRIRPRALILGSSRAEIGLDPEHPAWGEQMRPVFNFAVGGASIGEVRRLLEFACRHQPPGQVVLGLDLFMFNALRGAGEEPPPASGGDFSQLAETVFSITALRASLDTLRTQDPLRYPGYLPNGQITWSYYLAKVHRHGHHEAFVRTVRKYLAAHYFPPPHRIFTLTAPAGGSQPLEEFARILDLARRHAIDLRLFISPVHAWQLLTIEEAALWPVFEAWKRGLVEALTADRQAHPEVAAFPLWDFSGFNPVTTEALPAPGDTSTLMHYYWEPSHYRKETGDLVLARVLGGGPERPDQFGTRLETATIDGHLAEMRAGLADYSLRHPEAAAAVARVRAEFPYLTAEGH